ncbi:MAG: hypothetical protein FJ138_12575 [Deltaproteobacteria bacterium]|nr:hypothetical protein [Deltaproteobacteria bacterium]
MAPAPAARAPSAQELCGDDRRCRLARLKKVSASRHFSAQRGADFQSLKFMDTAQARGLSDLPRLRRPWGADLLADLDSATGVSGRYNLSGHWQVQVSYQAASYTKPEVLNGRVIDLRGEGLSIYTVEGVYLTRLSGFTPLVGLGARYLTGQAYIFDTNAPADPGILGSVAGLLANLFGSTPPLPGLGGGGPARGEGELEGHLLSLKAGVDYQALSGGFHARLVGTYTYPVFMGHRDAGTGDNLPTRQSAADWAASYLTWNLELSLGWSF